MTSHVISLAAAVHEIRTAYYDRGHSQPFFFVVGAGMSAPNVPLARDIIEHCRGRVGDREGEGRPATAVTVLDAYSYWFDRAYPQPADRQRYLRSLIDAKPLSDASLRLAHVLASRKLANLVVTPNFDDFISRALNVFGVMHAVSDHPDTVDRIDLASEDVKIVHVHGSYKFYDCRNLRDEVELRARPSARTTRTMAAFLDRALSFSSPLVIGYGGWEDDVIMSALRRRIEGASLPYRLYWFLHRAENLSDLETRAPWLTEHPDVRVITSDVPGAARVEASTEGATDSPALTAQIVLEALSRAFDIGEPEITRDPVGFFARQLRTTLLHDADSATADGIYSFSTVVARLERAAELEAREFATRTVAEEQASLEDVRRLLRESKYAEAIKIGETIVDSLAATDRVALYVLLNSAPSGGYVSDELELHRSDLLLRIAETTPAVQSAVDYPMQHGAQLVTKGYALYHLKRLDEALVAFDDVIRLYGASPDPRMMKLVRYAKTRKALTLGTAGRPSEAVLLYDEIIPELKDDVWLRAKAEFNRAGYLRTVAGPAAAATAFETFADTYADGLEVWMQALVAGALEESAEIHASSGETAEAIRLLKKLIELYDGARHEQLAPIVARALLRLATLQIRAGEKTSGLETLHGLRRLGPKVTKETRAEELRLRIEAASEPELPD